MKKLLAIFLLFAVVIGTVSRDVCGSKAIKTVVMNDNDTDDNSADEDGDSDSKDLIEKDKTETFFHSYHLSFRNHVTFTAFHFVSTHDRDFDDPYLESISEPPESVA